MSRPVDGVGCCIHSICRRGSRTSRSLWTQCIQRRSRWPLKRGTAMSRLGLIAFVLAMLPTRLAMSTAQVHVEGAGKSLTFLSWDTEGGKRAEMNLLRMSAAVQVRGAKEATLGASVQEGR